MANLTREERKRRDDEAKANNLNENPFGLTETGNPREPNYPVREDRDGPPMRGDAGVAVGRIGTIAPLTQEEIEEDEEKAKLVAPDPSQMQVFRMKLKHGVFLEEGKKTARGEIVEVPQDRARQLFEDGVAEFVHDLPV
jgi:hypothetical protein